MAAKQIATIGCSFEGYCSKRGHGNFTGVFSAVEGNGSPVISLNGKPVCVTGTTGIASCGCTVRAIGKSTAFKLNGLEVARVGDPIVEDVDGGGSITGTITTGMPWLAID